MGRQRKTSAKHRTAGVDPTLYADFAVDQRVRTVEGLLGTVTAVEDGPFPGTEQYLVTLDDGMGGGEYGASELTALAPTQASATEARAVEAMPVEATGLHTAAEDYPELASILVERPPLPHSEPMRMHAAARTLMWSSDTLGMTVCNSCWKREPGSEADGWRAVKSDDPRLTEGVEVCSDCGKTIVNRARDAAKTAAALVRCETCDVDYAIDSEAEKHDHSKTAAPVDWADVEQHFWCEACGFSGDVPPATSGIDTCPSCGATSAYLQPGDLALAASKTEQAADQHVLIATSSLWDRVLDLGADILNSQMDEEFKVKPGTSLDGPRGNWCRFLKNERCFFPKTLNEAATARAGYAVWNPEDRGRCPRTSWDLQKKCPVSEPGPNSGDPQARVDATVRWEDGGQRLPEGWTISPDDYDPRLSSLQKQTAFEFTAAWSDIRNKAKRIRSEGGVRIISAPRDENDLTITAEVKGDSEVYETTLLREPGKKNVASWSCGCAWAAYSWGRSGRWKKYEGRMCSHALALQYEAQARGFGGKTIQPDAETPPWRVNRNPFEYGRAASLRPVCLDGDLADAPLTRIEREAALTVEAKAMLFRGLKALVRGGIRFIEFVQGGAAQVRGVGKVDLSEVIYPTWHPSLGLSLSHTAAAEAHVVDGSDGPHIPGTDHHYPYDRLAFDPSRWGRDHFALVGDDLYLFESGGMATEMEQGDPMGAGSFVAAAKTAEIIDIGTGRDQEWGQMGWADHDMLPVGRITSDDPEGFLDPLAPEGHEFAVPPPPENPEPALPQTEGEDDGDALGAHLFEGSLRKQAFDIPNDVTPEQAADFLIAEAAKRANFVTALLRDLARKHGGRMDGETFRLKGSTKDGLPNPKGRARMIQKINDAVRKRHIRPDQAAEEFQDALRFTMLLPPSTYTEGVKDALADLAGRGIRPLAKGLLKNYWLRGDEYDGINSVLRLPDGFPFELQFHTDATLEVKMKNHDAYEEYRGSKGPVTPARRQQLWDQMSAPFSAIERPPGAYPGGGYSAPGNPAAHVHSSFLHRTAASTGTTYYAFANLRAPGTYTGVFRKVVEPGDVRFERYSNSRSAWVEDLDLAGLLIKGDPTVEEVSEVEAQVIVAVTRDLEGQALLDRLTATAALTEVAHVEALVVEALDTPEMVEAVGQSLTEAPPGPGDPRLSWLMGGTPSANPGAGEGNPQTASDGDIAAAAKAHLAKQALKAFSPEEQAEIINEGIDVQAANLSDLDIKGTHYEGLEAALQEHEALGDDEDGWLG